jgi:hypothetical protein
LGGAIGGAIVDENDFVSLFAGQRRGFLDEIETQTGALPAGIRTLQRIEFFK